MSNVKKLPYRDLDNFVQIVVNAYPGFISAGDAEKVKDRLVKMQKNDPRVTLYGLYRKNELLGGMRIHNFRMNFLSTKIDVGGVGLVAVDLMHKKEKVCKELIEFFHNYCIEKKYSIATLYPFRPDFYRKMGYGNGTKMNRYKIKPEHFPKGSTKKHLRFLKKNDAKKLLDCYNCYCKKTHGLIERIKSDVTGFFENPNVKVIGFKSGKEIRGYIAFTFKKEKEHTLLSNNLNILEFIYHGPEVFLELSTFLHSQLDQVNRIVYETQDEYFHHLPVDPRDGSEDLLRAPAHETNVQGVGIMYRVLDCKKVFRVLKKNSTQNCRIKITINDDFVNENDGSFIVHFIDGKPVIRRRNYDFEISMGIAEFSILIMGVINFKSLVKYGLAKISNLKFLDVVNNVFSTREKPICMTYF